MRMLDSFDDLASCQGGVLAIGNFDGVHRGHQKMLSLLTERAESQQVPAVVLTFDPPPVELLRPDAVPPRLMTLQTKARFMELSGVDCLIAYPTDFALLNLSPEQFFETIVLEKLDARGMVEGPNFYFGKNRRGDVKFLGQLCEKAGLSLDVIEPEYEGDLLISSSTIRRLLAEGDFDRARRLLGHAYRLEGVVVRGESRGRLLGFPTANLSEITTLIPGDGVYFGSAWVDETPRPAAIHIGSNPTFQEDQRKVEVHILDFSGELYGQPIQVDLQQRIRGTKSFRSAEELKQQIENDLAAVRRLAKSPKDR